MDEYLNNNVVDTVINKAMNNEIEVEENTLDLESGQDQEFFVQKAIDVINTAYEKYKADTEKIRNNKKYANEYKEEKCQELKEQFLFFKELQLDKAEDELEKIRTHLKNMDNIENSKQDKLLNEISKMNLLNMINIGMKFDDDTFIKSKIDEIVKHEDLKIILENKIKKTKKSYLLVNIERAYQTQNAKYISLDKLQNKIKTMRGHKDTVFKTTDMSKLELIK